MPETLPDTPERCTCGAVLVENASFCHRCGRPTHELTAAEQQEFAPPPPPTPPQPAAAAPPPPLPISFGNPIALRVAFLMSLGIMMVEMLPVVNYLFLAWWLMGGWWGVRLYRRLTGLRLSVASGARLGFITGLFAFLSMAVVFSLTMASSTGRDLLDQMVKQNPQMSEVVNNPAMLGVVLVMCLVFVFVLVSGICAAGGALGAKFGTPPNPRTEPHA
jgi:hypothetical protein